MSNATTAAKLLIFDTHPVQYRGPLYAKLEQLRPGSFHVVYASDFSVRGGRDPGFGTSISWDSDLLAGYPHTFLQSHSTFPLFGWNSLKGNGVAAMMRRFRPHAILLTSLNYRFDYVAYLGGKRIKAKIWIRCETQDEALKRSRLKQFSRSLYYRLLYSGLDFAFPIGRLNRQHWLNHGLSNTRLANSHYCTPNPLANAPDSELVSRRLNLRQQLNLPVENQLVAFFGKLIPKKDPCLLLEATALLPESLRSMFAFVFVGSGELESELRTYAAQITDKYAIPVFFPGFVNQSALPDWYLAADTVVLPSRRMGETWGLVVNEALQAGCGVVITDAVGCAADFGSWDRVRVIPEGSITRLADALADLAQYQRSFHWARKMLKPYTIEAAAQSIAAAIDNRL